MKKLLAILALLPAMAFAQNKGVLYDVQILKVTDGDTIVVAAPYLPAPLKPQLSVRVYGVDTPEKGFRAKCESENQRGLAASEFTKKLVNQSVLRQVYLLDWDKYGGRVLGDVYLDGQSLRVMLIQNGYAREYYGEAKTSWCN